MIRCKLTFRGYAPEYLQRFEKAFIEHQFTNIENLKKISAKHFDAHYNDILGERDEIQYAYEMKSVTDDLKQHRLCATLAEITHVLNEIQKEYKSNTGFFNKLDKTATVHFTLHEKNVYPENFSLQSVLPVHKVVFGNIYKRNSFNPVISVHSDRKESDILQQFLTEQKGISDYPYNMASLFEHDHQAFSTYFYDHNFKGPRVVELTVEYSSIRRITAYVCHTGDGRIGAVLTFQLDYPPYVHPRRRIENPNDSNSKWFIRDRYVTWNRSLVKEEDVSLNSCFSIECYDIDGNQLLDCFGRLQKLTGHDIEFRDLPCNTYIKRRFYEPNLLEYPEDLGKLLPEDLQKLKNGDEWYPLLYAVQALTSRGGEICDYFFRQPDLCFKKFLRLVVQKYEQDLLDHPDKPITKTVRALELMLDRIDCLLDLPEPIGLFNQLYDDQPDYESACELIQLLLADGYTRIRKVVCTPTRTLLFNPEMIMANRCIRASKSDNFICVLFRDDNDFKLFGTQRTLVSNTVGNFLKESKIFGMRTFSYLGSSDSQMHDHGCFLMAGTHEEVKQFKNTFGDFPTESIQKSMTNFGQFLTQSWSIPLHPVEYWEVMDHVGGVNRNNERYIFTDGVGIMSKDFAKDIAISLGYSDYTPSCVQMRYRGYKGLLVLDVFDIIGEYYEAEPDVTKGQRPKIIFRSSQKLFETDAETHPHFVELLIVSFPTSVTLNKPMINILDQVSEAQDAEIHVNVKNRIFQLLDNNIEDITSTLINNKSACAALNDYQKLIPSKLFGQFNVTEEPFFRSMLRSSALIRLRQLSDKMKIKIPATKARMMFGCIDESGLLQSGQVYIRFTNNIDSNFPTQAAERTTLTGRVMISKKSATVPGDVRLFEAVDVEGFADLVDVVVFSRDGERPNHNEICNSHFADEEKFTVIWDPELFIHHNEVPFTYIPPSPHVAELSAANENITTATELPEAKKDYELMADLFKNYVSDDCVGSVANAHLANSDLFGIFSETCSNISQKLYQAHNFQQSGIKPIPLTRESSNGMPPERVERYPNFMYKTVVPIYRSERILGQMHERLSEITDTLKLELNPELIENDPSLVVPGDEIYEIQAMDAYKEYYTIIQNMLNAYGLQNDGEIFSNHFKSFKRRLSDRNENSTTMFNTQYIIEKQLTKIYEKLRMKFFDEFGGIEKHSIIDQNNCHPEMSEIFSRTVVSPGIELRKKASAFYRIAYLDRTHLSFPWFIADILIINRQLHSDKDLDKKSFSPFSLENKLSKEINDLITLTKYENEFASFVKNMNDAYNNKRSNKDVCLPTARICQICKGFDKLLFFVRSWSNKHRLDRILPKVLDALVILFVTGRLTGESCIKPLNSTSLDLDALEGGVGRIFLKFLQYISTQKFSSSELINLYPVTNRKLSKEDCLMLYYEAIQTLYPISFNRSFCCLPGGIVNERDRSFEDEVFTIDLPMEVEVIWEELLEKLAKKCGCTHVAIKYKPEPRIEQKTYRFAIKAVGEFWNVWNFKRVLLPNPNMHEPNLQERSAGLPWEIYSQLKPQNEDGKQVSN